DGEPTVGVDGAVGPARGPRGVDDHPRVLGVQAGGRHLVGLVFDEHVPGLVAAVGPGDVAADPALHDAVLDRLGVDQRAVGHLLHRHHLAATVEAVGADQHLGLTVVEPAADGPGPVAAEERDVDG